MDDKTTQPEQPKLEQTREWTVRQAAELSGVSVRTLHYYDEIGLLPPARVTEAGYRLYGERELARLQQILLYRELDFPLAEIRALMALGGQERLDALGKQRELLSLKRDRLTRLIRLTDRLLKGENTMSFAEFDMTQIEEQKKKYAREVKERWGKTAAYAESEKRTASYGEKEWAEIQGEMEGLFRRFAACMPEGPESPAAQALVKEWQEWISAHFYTCTDEILAGLGQMYTADPRFRENFERTAPGLAEFISAAIAAYTA